MSETFGNFDFGLTAQQEARARTLHEESIVIDCLFQGPVGYRAYTNEMLDELEREWETQRDPAATYGKALHMAIRAALDGDTTFRDTWLASGITAANRQCGVDPDDLLVQMGITQAQFDSFDWLIKARTAGDIRAAKSEGKVAGFVSTQNTDGLDSKLDHLRAAYDFGLRMMALTYNTLNAVGSGCTERVDAGVSHFGARVIAAMNELGIIVDTCHSGKQTTLDACELSTKPVVASHTSAEELYKVDRAKSDDEIKALAATGGLIGIYAVPFFLSPDADVTVEAMLDHIDYVRDLVGVEHVAIGTDWPLQSPKRVLDRTLLPMVSETGFRPEHNIVPSANLIGFDDYRDFPNITRGLVKRGYTDDEIKAILGENFLRVFAECCG